MNLNDTIALNDRLAGLTQEELLALAALAATKAGATIMKGNTEDSTSTAGAPDDLPDAPENAKEATDPDTLSDVKPETETGEEGGEEHEEGDSTEDTKPADVSKEDDSTEEPTEQPNDAPQEEGDTETPTNDHDAPETSEESGEDTSTAEDGTGEEGGEEEPQDDAEGNSPNESGEDSGPECTPEVKTEDNDATEDTSTTEEEDTSTEDAQQPPQTPPDAPQTPLDENPFTPQAPVTRPQANPKKPADETLVGRCIQHMETNADTSAVYDRRTPTEEDRTPRYIALAGEMIAAEMAQYLTLPPSVKDRNLHGLTSGDLDEDGIVDAYRAPVMDCFMLHDREQSARIRVVFAVDVSTSMSDSGDIHIVNALMYALRSLFAGTCIEWSVYSWSWGQHGFYSSSHDSMTGNAAGLSAVYSTQLGVGVRDIIAHASREDVGQDYTAQLMIVLTDGDSDPYSMYNASTYGEALFRFAQSRGFLLAGIGFTGVTQKFTDTFRPEFSCRCDNAASVPAVIGTWLSNLVRSFA